MYTCIDHSCPASLYIQLIHMQHILLLYAYTVCAAEVTDIYCSNAKLGTVKNSWIEI